MIIFYLVYNFKIIYIYWTQAFLLLYVVSHLYEVQPILFGPIKTMRISLG